MGAKDRLSNMIPIDKISNAMINISHDHHKIHEGDKYYARVQLTIPTLTTQRITFITPTDVYIHYQRSGVQTSSDKVSINFYEGGVVNVAGTLVNSHNRDLNSPLKSGVIIRTGDTYASVGTKLDAFCSYIPGSTGVGQAKAVGASATGEEIILKRDTVYVYEIVNGSSDSNIVDINFSWYTDEDY